MAVSPWAVNFRVADWKRRRKVSFVNNDVILASMRLGKRIVRSGVVILVLLIAAWANYLFEPFAKRFEGRTGRQWLKQFAHEQRVDERTVDAFETTVVRDLVSVIQTGRREATMRSLLREATGIRTQLSSEESQLMLAAGSWLSWLHARGYELHYDGPGLGLWLDRYDDDFFGPRYVQLALTTPDQATPALDIPMAALAPGQRIDAAIAIEPKKIGPSKSVGLFVKLRIAPGHYIYSLERSGKSNEPTSFEVNLPNGFSLSGPWKGPEPKRQTDGSKVFRGDVVFWNHLSASPAVPPGKRKMSVKVSFQVCNEAVCWPPQKISRELELEVTPTGRKK